MWADFWPAAIIALLALATTAGGFFAFRVARNTSVVAGYKEAAESSERVASALRAEVEQQKGQLIESLAREKVMEGKIATLTELVTGHAAIEQLTAQVIRLAGVKEETMAEVVRTRTEILDALRHRPAAARSRAT